MMISCLRKVSIIFHNEAKNHVKCDASLRPDAIKASLMKLRNKNLINCPRKVFYFLSSQSSHFWFAEKKKVDFCPIVLCIITKSLSFQQIFFLCLENLKIALFLQPACLGKLIGMYIDDSDSATKTNLDSMFHPALKAWKMPS